MSEIDVMLIADTFHTARVAHRCSDCVHGIQPGDRYRRIAQLVDGDFYVYKQCLWCEAGVPRPGTPEHDALIADCERQAREDEADYQADQAFHREVVAHPERHHPSVVDYARASLGPEGWPS